MVLDMEWMSKKADEVRRKSWVPWTSYKHPKRAILKNGSKNVMRTKLAKISKWRYLQDIFTTLLDAQWRWTVQFIVIEFFGSWLIFALIWWLIAFVHGDLQEDHLPLRQPESGWVPCILNIHGFHSCFLYSLETQHTTGYGLRVITEECPEAIFIMCFQCIIGMILDSFTIELPLKADGGTSSLFLLWPLIIYHEIDGNSPLYDFTIPEILKNQKVEIIVILNATVESTGASIETTSSYLSSEILWRRRFESVVSFNKHVDSYEIDWSKFDNTVPINLRGNEEEYVNESDTQETIILDHHDPGCSFSPSQKMSVHNPSYHHVGDRSEEMISFDETETFLPCYRKPPPPVWQMNQRIDPSQEIKPKYNDFPETINESDESQEMQITYV